MLRRQRTILGVLLREVEREIVNLAEDVKATITPWLERAKRIHSPRPKDKNKLFTLHAPKVGCIGKGTARKPFEWVSRPAWP